MTDAESQIAAELKEVREQLAGYDELKERERRLSAALAVLSGDAPTSTGDRLSSGPLRARRREGRTGTIIDREAIISALRRHNDMPATYISDQLELQSHGITSAALSRVLADMVRDGQLNKTGERRATKYQLA
jgi:hypothetical protein